MNDAAVIYPHQLFENAPMLAPGRTVLLVEEPLILSHNPVHRARLVLHKRTMDAYQQRLENAGHTVQRLTIGNHPTTQDVFARIRALGFDRLHIADTHDADLERAIGDCGMQRQWYETPQFLLPRAEAEERYLKSRRFMASFYRTLRLDRAILLDDKGGPLGGQWSFDADNRRRIPVGTPLPGDIDHDTGQETRDAARWAESFPAERYGEPVCWLPVTHDGARAYLDDFIANRFREFGAFEDAITTRGVRLWHSALSPLINIGLLTPHQVLDAALAAADKSDVPINSLEGFVRQVLGWREFIRAAHEVDGSAMRNSNFWNHQRPLPASFWTAETGLAPVDHTIRMALAHGYSHHIERLMVMGNIMLLAHIRPADVYRWFMGFYIDAYDWVMVPNVYAMSQFADGGSFATKPYISGGNYLRKMSDHAPGDWEASWTALYWAFIRDHQNVFEANHRLSMMPRLLARMKPETRQQHFDRAEAFLKKMHR